MRLPSYQRLSRAYGLLAATIGTIGIIGIVILLGFMISQAWRSSDARNDGRAPPPEVATSLNLPAMTEQDRIGDTPFLALKVGEGESGGSGPYGSGYIVSDYRNILLVDLRDGGSRYVLPDNSRRLAQWHVVPSGVGDREAPQVYVALVERIQAEPTAPSYDVLIGNLTTAKQIWAVRGVSAMGVPEVVEGHAVGFLIWRGGRLAYHRFNFDTLAEELARAIPLMKAVK